MKSLFTLSGLLLIALFLMPGCGAKKGPLVAKVKGLKVYQSELDSLYPDVRDKDKRNERLQEYIKTNIDEQVLYLKARKMKFDRQPENKAILKNIEMIEAANYYNSDVIQKNWGFLEKEVLKAYNADKNEYRLEKPKMDSVPTPDQKKAMEAYNRDPYKSLDQVRTKVLRKLLLSQPENKKAMNELVATMKKDSLDSARITQKEDEIINAHVGDLETRLFEKLKKDHKVELLAYVPKITEEEIKAEWEKTKNTYKRKPDYTVQHIAVPDEKTARDIVDKVNNQNKDFAPLQKKYSLNKETKGKTFTVTADGDVKDLTGISDTRGIYARIMYVPAGKVSNPIGINTPDGKPMQHVFKIVTVEPEAIQTYEEAKQSVRNAIYARKQIELPLNTILAKVDGKAVTAEQVFTLLFKMSPMVVERYKAEEGRKALLEKYYLRFMLYTELAKSQGLLGEDALQERIEKSQKTFLVSDFRQSYLDVYFGVPESEARKFYKDHPDTFLAADKKVRPFDQVKADVITRVLVNPKMIEEYYNLNMEDYADNDGAPKPLKDVASTINYTILSKEKERRSAEALRQYRREFGLKIYKKELDFNTVRTPEAIFEETKKLHEDRKYAEATRNYLDLRYRYPKFNSHPDICMALAQIYIEQNQYYKAIQEYKRFMRLYPDHKDKYKAQFMIGFVYSENLKDKDKAISSYQSVLDNYPSCDLVESAKFMIEHLKSGKDDFSFLGDSTAVSDSAAPVTAAETKKETVKKEDAKKKK